LIEVLTGRRPDAEPGARPRPEFDPSSRSLRQRELGKLAELRANTRADISGDMLRE
jgi:putative transposase